MIARYKQWLLTLLILILLVTYPGSPAIAESHSINNQVTLLSSSDKDVVFNLNIPWQTLDKTPVTIDEKTFISIELPGFNKTNQPGAPQLPYLNEAIGAPIESELSLNVIPGKSHTILLSAPVMPSPTPVLESTVSDNLEELLGVPALSYRIGADPKIYSGQASYPAELAEISADGIIHGQRVVGLNIFPVVYHPDTNAITIYENLQIEIKFTDFQTVSEKGEKTGSKSYQALFQNTLLNYEQALDWWFPLEQLASLNITTKSDSTQVFRETPWQPPDPGWRISIQEDGIHELTYTELQSAGLPVETLNPKTFQIYYMGEEIAIEVTGEDDLSFDQADSIRFFGQGISSKYTADNVYWLTIDQYPGLRMVTRDVSPVSEEIPSHYPLHHHKEINQWYRRSAPGDDDQERFLWEQLYATKGNPLTWSHTFEVTQPHDGSGELTIALLGGFQIPTVNPDHHAVVSLNGVELGDLWWDGITWKIETMAIDPGILQSGENELTVLLPNDTGYTADFVYVDWFALEINHSFIADTGTNVMAFSYEDPGTWQFGMSGFSKEDLAIYDVSDPINVASLENFSIDDSDSAYTLLFTDEVGEPKDFWVSSLSEITPIPAQQIIKDTPSNLLSVGFDPEHIIITHDSFWQEALMLKEFRINQGLKAILVDVQDIYDEFGFGIVGTSPIRDFLSFANTYWGSSSVLLVGDGHYDPKNYLGHNQVSFIPPYLAMTDPWIGETAADNRYVTFSDLGTMPQMMLGRLSVNTPSQANAFIQKIIAYEQSPASGNWQRQVLSVAAAADSAGNFANLSDNLIKQTLSAPYYAEKVYYKITHTELAEAQTALKSGINDGSFIVNFIGHGYSAGWTAQNVPTPQVFLNTADVPNLTNEGRYPIILAMTCTEGAFHQPNIDAMAEVITRAANKGAVASWSPTGQGTVGGHELLNHGFFEAVFQQRVKTVGEAVYAGNFKLWLSGSSLYLLDTFLLFGDPASEIARFDNYYFPIFFNSP